MGGLSKEQVVLEQDNQRNTGEMTMMPPLNKVIWLPVSSAALLEEVYKAELVPVCQLNYFDYS